MKTQTYRQYITKIFLLLSTFVIIFNFTGNVIATNNQNEIKVNFSDYSYTLYDYNRDDVYINYSTQNNKEIANIVSKEDGIVLETLEVEKLNSSNKSYFSNLAVPYATPGTTTAHNFVRTKKFGLTELKLVVLVEIYSYGSFRQINSIKNKSLSINSSFTTMRFENKVLSVWPNNNRFPATVLHYGYSGTLVAPYEVGADAGIQKKLIQSGFNASGKAGSTIYYRRTFNTTGKISLY